MGGVVREGRAELKYALPLCRRAEVLDIAGPYIDADENALDLSQMLPELRGIRAFGYRVSSLYLDDVRLDGYAQRLDNRRIRNRIRIRTYGEVGERQTVFLEAKRKLYSRVIKHRYRACDTDTWAQLPGPRPWLGLEPSGRMQDHRRLERWVEAVERGGLQSVCRVEYIRETFVAGTSRLTIDHRVAAAPTSDAHALRGPCPVRLLPDGWVVLELKFDEDEPVWMRTLVQRLGLVAEPVSKFALGVARTVRSARQIERDAVTPPSILKSLRQARMSS